MSLRGWMRLAAGTLLSLAVGVVAAAQPSDQQVRKLMDAIGLGKSLNQMNSQVASSMQQSLPCVSPHYWENFIDPSSSQEFIGRLVPIYQRHFSADEVDGLIKFYSSPLGQKVLTEMPLALAEANQAGQQWSHEHSEQMIAKLQQAGTLNDEGRCPGTAAAPDTAVAAETAGNADDEAPAPTVAHGRHGRVTHPSAHKGGTTHKAATAPKKAAAKKTVPAKKKTTSTKTSTGKPGKQNKSSTPVGGQ